MHRDKGRQHVGMGPLQAHSAGIGKSDIPRQAHSRDLLQMREGMEVRSGLDMVMAVDRHLDW
jgi:hypothetical protein